MRGVTPSPQGGWWGAVWAMGHGRGWGGHPRGRTCRWLSEAAAHVLPWSLSGGRGLSKTWRTNAIMRDASEPQHKRKQYNTRRQHRTTQHTQKLSTCGSLNDAFTTPSICKHTHGHTATQKHHHIQHNTTAQHNTAKPSPPHAPVPHLVSATARRLHMQPAQVPSARF